MLNCKLNTASRLYYSNIDTYYNVYLFASSFSIEFIMELYLLMYLARLAKKLFSSSSFYFSCLGHHNPNCMTYVPPTLNVLFSCTSSSSPHRRRSRFLCDRNYAINYPAPYLSFLSHPFFVFFSNYCRRYSTRPQSQI